MRVPYTITGDSVTLVWEGKTHTVQRGAANFHGLRQALLSEDWDTLPNFFTAAKSLKEWSKGEFSVNDAGNLTFKDVTLPMEINRRAMLLAEAGEDPTPILNFWQRLQKNPSWRSVQQLWGFLEHGGIPITEDGCFLAYKGVNQDYTDCHTGTILNEPGSRHTMPRNAISDDPTQVCHFGFHVGAYGYAGTFGSRCVICKVDPEHVVCVPVDYSAQKMRVCQYEVIGNYGVELPSVVWVKEKFEDKPFDPGTNPFRDDLEDDIDEDLYDDGDEGPDADPIDADSENEEENTPTPVPKVAGVPRKRTGPFRRYDKLGMSELMQLTLDELRRYAGHGLQVVGASKIPGGKVGLIKVIKKTRGD